MDRVDEITRDCFNALVQLLQLEPTAPLDPVAVHNRLCSFIDALVQRAGAHGFRPEDAQEIAYPIVALADEIMLAKSDNLRQFWASRLLQLRYFKENVAGENFFVRLDALLHDPHRVEILRVYYLCLLFGFQGRYQVRGGELELQNLREQAQQALARARVFGGDLLSPKGARPPDIVGRAQRGLPIVALAIVAVLLAIGLNVGLKLYLGSQTSSVVQKISAPTKQK